MFTRHENNKFHKDCKEEFLKICPAPIAPVLELWTSKISKQLNSELCCKFVASNLLATEQISNKKYRPVLKAFKKVGAPVGDTHQNLDGFNIFWGVQADKLWQDQKQNFGGMESFGLQADGAHNKSQKLTRGFKVYFQRNDSWEHSHLQMENFKMLHWQILRRLFWRVLEKLIVFFLLFHMLYIMLYICSTSTTQHSQCKIKLRNMLLQIIVSLAEPPKKKRVM